jgi:hypothetical protein
MQVVFPKALPVSPNTPVAKTIKPVTCTAWADPHYTTWDGAVFDFFHIGTYYMVCYFAVFCILKAYRICTHIHTHLYI